MAKAVDVARHILAKAQARNICLDPLQLQKLLYFAQGWHLGLRKTPMFNEAIEAWAYGPVVASVYREFKKYGSGDISSFEGRESTSLDPSISETVDQVINTYGNYSGSILSGMTHRPDGPWKKTYREDSKNQSIPNSLITEYFSTLKSKNRIC
jgi:uncharacterized phage-associated protein